MRAWLHYRIELLDGLEAISTAQIIEDDCRQHAIESAGTNGNAVTDATTNRALNPVRSAQADAALTPCSA
jgi:hypothetical protein